MTTPPSGGQFEIAYELSHTVSTCTRNGDNLAGLEDLVHMIAGSMGLIRGNPSGRRVPSMHSLPVAV